ncbi:MAG: hypothetical protein WC556_02635 [Candidatus Methanoperedens sp.]
MRVEYRLPVKQDINIPVPLGTNSIVIEIPDIKNTKVQWEVDAKKNLSAVVLVIYGLEIKRESKGNHISPYPEPEDEMYAYRLAVYIANCILIQTGFDAIDPEKVLLAAPHVFPETTAEETRKSASGMNIIAWEKCTINVLVPPGEFLPKEYPAGFCYSAASASYADGLRVSSLFLKYEQFYKVVEHFFTEQGEKLDAAVSKHASQYDQVQIKKLRDLRNRCIHPQMAMGHVNPENMNSIQEVRVALPTLRNLAFWLLHNPPPSKERSKVP